MQTDKCSFDQDFSQPDGTSDRVAHPKYWVATLVQMNTERRVCDKLKEINIETYLPIQTEMHQWSDRRKKIDRIVIPMIVFVRLDKETEKILKTYSFIRKILSYPGQSKSAVIPDEQIMRLKFMLENADSSVELNERIFHIGENVKIVRGPLKNLEGELCYFNAERPMVAIRIDCLGYACVNVSKNDIESI